MIRQDVDLDISPMCWRPAIPGWLSAFQTSLKRGDQAPALKVDLRFQRFGDLAPDERRAPDPAPSRNSWSCATASRTSEAASKSKDGLDELLQKAISDQAETEAARQGESPVKLSHRPSFSRPNQNHARCVPRRVKIFKRPGSNIEAGHQGVLDSGRAGEP